MPVVHGEITKLTGYAVMVNQVLVIAITKGWLFLESFCHNVNVGHVRSIIIQIKMQKDNAKYLKLQ